MLSTILARMCMHNENLHNLDSSVNIIWVKIDKILATAEPMVSEYRNLGQSVDKRMLLKWIFKRRVRENGPSGELLCR
jgi:hypothetical protein